MTIQNHKTQSGFTLLELIVVVAVLGLITSLATDFVINDSNQKRFEVTQQRLDEIKYAIIGNTTHVVNNQPVVSGFYADLNRLPKTLSELIFQCRDSSDIGVNVATESACKATTGNVWEASWNGPYLRSIQTVGGQLVFQDGWGNNSTDGHFGWIFDDSTTNGSLIIQSKGLDKDSTGTDDYEVDYPSAGNYLVTRKETDHIDYLRGLASSSGYCVYTDTSTSVSTIDLNYSDSASCVAVSDHIWANYP